jgi:YVTN family beta-propeller protein
MAGLPAGTVTLLFTDIEGATELLKRLRDGYGEVLVGHERILRSAIEEAGGQIVDTQGDAVFAVFPRARAAVSAAAAAQRALTAEPWPEGGAVRVRMGLHSGEPALGVDRYVGLGVHRAARISAVAHGGQVLLSGATRELVEDELPSGVRIVDLGEYRLKDIDRPEHLFQLVVDGLQSEFPPLRTGVGDAASVALADAVGRRRFLRSRRSVLGLALGVVLVASGLTAFLVTGGGSSRAASVSADSVGFIDGRGRVRSQVSVDAAPTAVAYGDGAIWAANSAAGTVSRIDPLTRSLQQTIPVGQSPSGIVAGGSGVWVANHDDGTVAWINPTSNSVVKEIPVGAGPTAIAFGFESVWVTNSDDRTVTRIDARRGTVTARIPTKAVGRGIAVGGGSVWVTDEATRSVVQIDPATNTVTSPATVGAGPTGIAYGDGSVWVANALDGTVSRVDTRTLAVQATIPVGDGPSAVAFGSGSVWVSVEFGNRVVRIDPRRGIAIGSTAVGNRPEGLTVAGGGIWLAVQASGRGHRGGRLVILGDTLDSIDPALANSTASFAVLSTVYDGLTSTRRVGGSAATQLEPDLATALPLPTDGGRTYTFRLRPGIRYSDGRSLRPADFRRALEREIELPGQNAALFSKVRGALRCKPHRPCDLSRGVVASGPLTLSIHLVAPDPRLLLDLASLIPVPAGTPAGDVGTKPVPSTGAYAIESYVPRRLLTLVRNHYFRLWSAAARPSGYPDEIVYRPVKSVGSDRAVAEVLAGKADLAADTVPNSRVQDLKARYPRQLHLDPQQATAFVFLNVRRAPFDDVRVRRALNFAVDRKRVATLHGGALIAQSTCQLVPPTETGYARYCPYTIAADPSGEWKAPDLAKARALIAASGTRGQTIVVWSFSYFHNESQYFVALLHRLGYRARLHYIVDLAGYFGALYKTPSAQAGFAGFFGTGPTIAADMLTNVSCRSPNNFAHFCNPRIDAQIAQLTKEEPSDPAGSAKLAATIDREITDAAPWVPLFTPRFAELTSARVGNYQSNASGVLFDQLWVR